MIAALRGITAAGAAVWADDPAADLPALLDDGVTGVVCGPRALGVAARSGRYDDLLATEEPGRATRALAVAHARALADVLLARGAPGADTGRVSVDAGIGLPGPDADTPSPRDVLRAAHRVAEDLDRPNVLVQVPGGQDSWPVIEELVAAGVRVDVTGLVGQGDHRAALSAVLAGLERCPDPGATATAVSLVLSELDTEADKQLWKRGSDASGGLRGRLAVAVAQVCHQELTEVIAGARWQTLARAGTPPPGAVWRSVLARDPYYPDTIYLDPLVGPGVAVALPEPLLDLLRDGAPVQLTPIADHYPDAHATVTSFSCVGVDLATAATAGRTLWQSRRRAAWRSLDAAVEQRRTTTPLAAPRS